MNRREEIRKIHKKYRLFYEMLAGASVLVVCVLAGAGAFGGENIDYRMNLFTEGMGIVATVFVINRWYAHRERSSLQSRLIREAGSRSHDIAISAVEWMDREGWLRGEDGLLKGANLREARLQDARMDGANLMGSQLEAADLRNTKLAGAKFTFANLFRADLASAFMREANLQDAGISWANLCHAQLDSANVRNARLSQSRLLSANLNEADFEGAFMLEADLGDASVVGTSFKGANLRHAKLKDAIALNFANFEGAELPFVDLRGVNLGGCNLERAKLQSADLRDAKLDGANLQQADLLGALMHGISFVFEGPTFRRTVGRGLNDPIDEHMEYMFSKTDWSGARLPDGTIYTDDMDYEEIVRFVDRRHNDFDSTLAKVMANRRSMGVRDNG